MSDYIEIKLPIISINAINVIFSVEISALIGSVAYICTKGKSTRVVRNKRLWKDN